MEFTLLEIFTLCSHLSFPCSFLLSQCACHNVRYQSLTNIDISRVVIDQMVEKYKDKSALTYQQMNVCSLEFPDESFDAVIGKGLMDAILCGEGSTANVAKMCQEVRPRFPRVIS